MLDSHDFVSGMSINGSLGTLPSKKYIGKSENYGIFGTLSASIRFVVNFLNSAAKAMQSCRPELVPMNILFIYVPQPFLQSLTQQSLKNGMSLNWSRANIS